MIRKYIVQDLENFEFLCPHPEEVVGFTPFLNQAGHFEEFESAVEAGEDMLCSFLVLAYRVAEFAVSGVGGSKTP